jgi:hypothetical protein
MLLQIAGGKDMNQKSAIAGYDFGSKTIPRSPISLDDLRKLEESAGITKEDEKMLRIAGDVLSDQAEAMVDAWRIRIGEHEHLAKWFFGPNGKPDDHYKAAVRPRFVQWVEDLCNRPYDQAWLDYQEEIGQRHTPNKKNKTDHVESASLVPLRYILAFGAIIITTAEPFLAAKGHSEKQVKAMHAAWTKAVLLTLALWARPFTRENWW